MLGLLLEVYLNLVVCHLLTLQLASSRSTFQSITGNSSVLCSSDTHFIDYLDPSKTTHTLIIENDE
jgi:hypothetical protein